MNPTRRSLLAALGIAGTLGIGSVVAGVSPAAGWGGGHRGWHHRHGRHGHFDSNHAAAWIARRAGATDEQREQIERLAARFEIEAEEWHKRHEGVHQDVTNLLTSPQIDRAALHELRREQEAQADAALARLVDTLADIAEVLTPDQRALLAEELRWWGA